MESEAAPVEKSWYLACLHAESQSLAEAARHGLDLAIPSCPGWNMASLVGHLGEAYALIRKNVAAGTGEQAVQRPEDLELPPEIEAWFRDGSPPDRFPPDLMEWFDTEAEALWKLFRDTESSQPAWTWWEPDQTAWFWMRRMANETAIHRWDAQNAVAEPEELNMLLAVDGIDEILNIYLPRWCRPKSTRVGNGERYGLLAADANQSWVIRFEGSGMSIIDEAEAADVRLSGTASGLILFLWQRIPASKLTADGDVSLLDHYFDFVPPD